MKIWTHDTDAAFDVMTPQPEGRVLPWDEGVWAVEHGTTITAPFTVGERVYLAEEWRVIKAPDGKNCAIQFRDGMPREYASSYNGILTIWENTFGEWQPAETLPELFGRKFATVKRCEPKRGGDFTLDDFKAIGNVGLDESTDIYFDNLWGWITEIDSPRRMV